MDESESGGEESSELETPKGWLAAHPISRSSLRRSPCQMLAPPDTLEVVPKKRVRHECEQYERERMLFRAHGHIQHPNRAKIRGSEEHDNDRGEIERLTQKRRKKVILPIHTELRFALELERDGRRPGPTDRVLLNPATGNSMTRPQLYRCIQSLGRRAGVPTARPHRFQDTLAVDLLIRGASPYDVAKMLGDTIETVEKHYTPFVKELRERVRNILETGIGLEELAQKASERPEIAPKRREVSKLKHVQSSLLPKSRRISGEFADWVSHRRHNRSPSNQ